MPLYRERLWASPAFFVATALIVPAVMVVFTPISFAWGVGIGIALYAGCVVWLVSVSPVVEVTETHFVAGRARIPVSLLGRVEPYDGHDAVLERGQRLDARAWLLIRGWIRPVVKVPVLDDADPVPYWLVSSRHPRELAHVLNERRHGAAEG